MERNKERYPDELFLFFDGKDPSYDAYDYRVRRDPIIMGAVKYVPATAIQDERARILSLLRSDEAVWCDIEPRALSDRDRGTSYQWADWLEKRLKE